MRNDYSGKVHCGELPRVLSILKDIESIQSLLQNTERREEEEWRGRKRFCALNGREGDQKLYKGEMSLK